MNKIKRQLSDGALCNEKMKKFRTINKNQKNSINCLENLSNELLLEIFNYLEGGSLHTAFSDLNIRFHHLLTTSSFRFRIILSSNSETISEDYTKSFLLPYKHQILSFHFHNTLSNSSIFLWFPVDSTFDHLESLTLTGVQSNELLLILVGLIHLPRLFSLTIRLEHYSGDLSFLYQLIFNLPKLKYNKLSSTNVSSLISIRSQFSPIEYLIIDHSCTLTDLQTILFYTPRLTHLICKQSLKPNRRNERMNPMITSELKHLSIPFANISFNELEMFIKKLSSQLQTFKFSSNRDPAYLNANRWEELIEKHLPYLKKFHFMYMEVINERLKVTPYHRRIQRFNSPFWIRKQWLFHLEIRTCVQRKTNFIYKISPRRNRSTEDTESSISPIVYSPLSIFNLSIMNSRRFFNIIRPILFPSRINVMNIQCRQIFIGILIQLIHLLPNLDILVVHCATFVRLKYEIAALRDVSMNNRITKIVLQQMTEFTQIQFFIHLCPLIQHLEIFCSNGIDPEALLRFIFTKNIKYIPNINSISLRLSKSNEELRKIIYLEELRREYFIKIEDNRIYLQRNKH